MADEVRRPMKYPYTFSAMVAHFPAKYYWDKVLLTRWLVYSSIVCMPIFYKIQKLSYNEENVKKWAKKDRQLLGLEPHDHH